MNDPITSKQNRPGSDGLVQRLVRPNDLRFPLEKLSSCNCTITVAVGTEYEKTHDCKPQRGNIYQRWVARQVAADILNGGGHYQFGGYTGALKKAYEMVDADCHQLAHWILRRVGYVCCCADLMKLTGTPEA
jgi:hypothetical protein